MSVDFADGTLIDARYEIISELGEGGMGCVYKARDIELNRLVAIKKLQPELLCREESRLRFEREGRILAQLTHPNLVNVYRYGIWNQVPYIAMEYVEGKSLLNLLTEQSRLTPAQVLDICTQVCNGMQAAHDRGAVHRDLKPGNLMISPEGQTKIVDFGLALIAVDDTSRNQRLTRTGFLVGSIYYMSPEQCKGLVADSRSDIYALGCIIYESLSGQCLFDADSPVGMMHLHATAAPPLLSEKITGDPLPVGWDALVLRTLQKEPGRRYQSMRELKDDLELIRSGRGGEIRCELPQVTGSKGTAVKIMLLAAVALIVVTFMVFSRQPASTSLIETSTAGAEEAQLRQLKVRFSSTTDDAVKRAIAGKIVRTLDRISQQYFKGKHTAQAIEAEKETLLFVNNLDQPDARRAQTYLNLSNHFLAEAMKAPEGVRQNLSLQALSYLDEEVKLPISSTTWRFISKAQVHRAICLVSLGEFEAAQSALNSGLKENVRRGLATEGLEDDYIRYEGANNVGTVFALVSMGRVRTPADRLALCRIILTVAEYSASVGRPNISAAEIGDAEKLLKEIKVSSNDTELAAGLKQFRERLEADRTDVIQMFENRN